MNPAACLETDTDKSVTRPNIIHPEYGIIEQNRTYYIAIRIPGKWYKNIILYISRQNKTRAYAYNNKINWSYTI